MRRSSVAGIVLSVELVDVLLLVVMVVVTMVVVVMMMMMVVVVVVMVVVMMVVVEMMVMVVEQVVAVSTTDGRFQHKFCGASPQTQPHLADLKAKDLFKVGWLADEQQVEGPAPAEVGHNYGIHRHRGEEMPPWCFEFLPQREIGDEFNCGGAHTARGWIIDRL